MTALPWSFTGKVCVVTGAGKGIGRAITLAFADAGAAVVAVSRTHEDLETLGRERRFKGGAGILPITGDVSDEATVKRVVARALKRFDRIDVLVNNAGIRFRRSLLKSSTTEWRRVLSHNLTSCFLCTREVGRSMIARKVPGRIVNIASVIGSVGLPDLSAYGASKGGMITLTKCLALEWAPYQINVNAIAPGFCETSYAAQFKRRRALYRFTLERTPQRRWGKPEDVAAAAVFLSSEASRYITGEVLHVDGGWCAW